MGFATIGDGATSERVDVTSSRSSITKIIGVSCVDIAGERRGGSNRRERWKILGGWENGSGKVVG